MKISKNEVLQLTSTWLGISDGNNSRFAKVMPPEDFLFGWRSLPDELKVEILSYLLPTNSRLDARFFLAPRKSPYDRRKTLHDIPSQIFAILACPETAALGAEFLYRENLVCFDITGGQPLLLPPKPLRKYVRCCEAQLNIEPKGTHEFDILALNHAGFPPMKSIALHIEGLYPDPLEYVDIMASARQRLSGVETMFFNTKELTVIYRPDDYGYTRIVDDLDDMLPGLFTIAGDQEDMKQVCERQWAAWENDVYVTKSVDEWPATLIRKECECPRRTTLSVRR